jgi:asparagine synthase (glutamine-hydrolysing)
MCGIAGIVSLAPGARVDQAELRTMASQLTHRGPDDEGYYVDEQARCGLAFRRLSIIDLETGNQPVSNEDGRIRVVFNGEIYNFRELRDDLKKNGHVFRTQGDAEVLAHLYEQHARDFPRLLNGMFAIAVWDAPRGELLLVRDRFGQKPLVYAEHNGCLYFASEAKAILAINHVPRELDPRSLHRYLVFQYVPAPHSIFRGFAKLPPGHSIRVRAHDRAFSAERYYAVPDPAPRDAPRTGVAELKAELDDVLARAVQRRLISDVPLGAFLSGGLDSSIIVGLMRRLGVDPLRTFSIGFDDARYDETRFARAAAAAFGAEHYERVVTPDAHAILDTLAYHYDEPFGDSSAIPTTYVSRHARESVTVALTGDAGDECFGGYDRYRAAALAGSLDWCPGWLRRGIAAVGRQIPHRNAKSRSNRAYRLLTAVGKSGSRRYLDWVNVFPPEILVGAYAPQFAAQLDFDEPMRWFDAARRDVDAHPAIRAMHADFETYLPYDLLTKVDIASMSCGLECRCPFLDPDVVAFACRLPAEYRMGKRLLRDWASGFLPPAILNRPKMGFGVPVGEWFRGPLRNLIEDEVLAPDSISNSIFCADWLRELCGAHLSGRENHGHRLWLLLVLERWRRRWLR